MGDDVGSPVVVLVFLAATDAFERVVVERRVGSPVTVEILLFAGDLAVAVIAHAIAKAVAGGVLLVAGDDAYAVDANGTIVPKGGASNATISNQSAQNTQTYVDVILGDSNGPDLDLTTIDAGAMELKLSEIDVPQLLQDIAGESASQIKRRDLTLNIELAEDATHFVGDDKRVRQILSNLLSNAVGFSASGATVRMGARRDNNDILLWVADTGKGMDDDFQERAFDRFQSRPDPVPSIAADTNPRTSSIACRQ